MQEQEMSGCCSSTHAAYQQLSMSWAAHTYLAGDENVLLSVAYAGALALLDANLAAVVRAGATAWPVKLQQVPAHVSAAWRGMAVGGMSSLPIMTARHITYNMSAARLHS